MEILAISKLQKTANNYTNLEMQMNEKLKEL